MLIAGAGGAAIVGTVYLWIGLAIAFVVAHFFLFCNVLRMSRPLELVWAATFAVLAVLTITTEALPWWGVFGICGLLTVLLAALQMRRPSYHGVGWKIINPRLLEWWRVRKE